MRSNDSSQLEKIEWDITRWILMPGRYMHDDWWHYLGIAQWQDIYKRDPRQARVIDLYIRHQFPAIDVVVVVNDFLQMLHNTVDRWPLFMAALGLMQLGCVDYLLRREYRQQLSTIMNREHIDQLVGLWRDGNREPVLEPEALLPAVQSHGYSAFSVLLSNEPFWPMIQLQLPKIEVQKAHGLTEDHASILAKIDRLERFL